MKVDMKQILGPDWEPEENPPKREWGRNIKRMGIFTLCLAIFGAFTVYQQMSSRDNALADAPYKESEVNPSFTIQHTAITTVPCIEEGEGEIPVLYDEGVWHASTKNGFLKTEEKQTELYKEYQTDWKSADTLAEMSFLNGTDGYILKEVWFGTKDSENRSDFIILSVPKKGKSADLSKVSLTNNPENPKLSDVKDGCYVPDKNDSYVICIRNGAVIRLVFESSDFETSGSINVYDYDVSDGGYYLNNDYYNKGSRQATSSIRNAQGNVYVDAVQSGINRKGNYSEDGVKLAFGGSSIGMTLENEARDGGLDTINVHNVMSKMATGPALGLVSGITADENIKWANGICAPNLFGGNAKGRTDYTGSKYDMVFKGSGSVKTLSSVKSVYGTDVGDIEKIGRNFWITDELPSYGTDGHDIPWGNGSKNLKYYRAGDRGPKTFEASNDGRNHNSFFGMSYTEDFTLPAGYTGPLDFFGYSDDDLWVYAAQIDDNGNVIEDTAVPVIDIGGVHDETACYKNLWDMIKPVDYGKEQQNWRLFVFWLERDGTSAKCYLRFSLPEAKSLSTKHETDSLVIKADEFGNSNKNRTFLFDDGTGNRYEASLKDGEPFTITSGKEFTMHTNSMVTIKGIDKGRTFTVKETGRADVWSFADGKYEKKNTISGTAGKDKRVCFLSTEYKGHITIGVEADKTPESGYVFNIKLDNVPDDGILAVDGQSGPHGQLKVDKKGRCSVSIGVGSALSLYNLPEHAEFSVTAEDIHGYHVSEIKLDGNMKTSGKTVSGTADAYVIYKYEENSGTETPGIIMKQSANGDWKTADITAKEGMTISYNITVTNSSDKSMVLTVKDEVPDKIRILDSAVSGDTGGTIDGRTITWSAKLKPKSSVMFPFTGTVTDGSGKLENKAKVVVDDKTVAESNVVKAIIK